MQDPDYPARELQMAPSPQTRGWQCPRFAKFPQEMTLQLSMPAMLSQIQILSHEHKVATRIEVYVGMPGPGGAPAQTKRLGYLSFASNEGSDFKARELKSVHVATPAQLLRLVFHKCHINKLNIYNQVGVVAVNIIGDPMGAALGAPGRSMGGVVADLALDMNVDAVTASKIRDVLVQKQAAVDREDYDECKRLKVVIDQLKALGMKVAHLEAQKQAAVEAEDYDSAKVLKGDIDALRSGGAAAAGIAPLPAPAAANATAAYDNGSAPHATAGYEAAPRPPSGRAAAAPEPLHLDHEGGYGGASVDMGGADSYDDRPAVSQSVMSGETADVTTPTRFKAMNLDEQPAVAQGRQSDSFATPAEDDQMPQTAAPPLPSAEGFSADLPPPEPLSAAAAKESHGMEEVLGEYTVLCLFSKNWVLRDAALQKLENQVVADDFPNHDAKEVFRTICNIIKRFLKDKVANVLHTALTLLKHCVSKYAPSLGIRETQAAAAELIPPLVEKTGDTNARMKDAAADVLLFLAETEEVGLSVIAPPTLKPVKNQAAWRPVLGRLHLLLDLVPKFGVSKTSGHGFPLEALMSFVNAAFGSTNGEVRNAAAKLTLEIYKKAGKAVEKALPKELKPAIKDVLTAGFAAINNGEEPPEELVPPPPKAATKPPPPKAAAPKPKPAAAVKQPPPKAVTAAEGEDEEEEGPADMCQFCAVQDPKLAEGENMDLHFYHDCPMLCSCAECGQIIEIASVNEHLLRECEAMGQYAECGRCAEAVRTAELEEHTARNSCVVAKSVTEHNRCPLCHMDIAPGDEGWRMHLLEGRGCPANTRPVRQGQ